MFNLVGNGIKFTDSGIISVSARLVNKENNYLEITVSDTGIGIPSDKLDHIFGYFEQADASITREYGGTGLGLYIVKETVDRLKGRITVISEPKKGTRFKIKIPPLKAA